jgi:predicted nucleic acid-binding protein
LARFTAFLDACVLYPAPLRDLLLELTVADLFRAKWSHLVHDEWTRSVLKTRPDLRIEDIQRTRALMDLHVRDALVGQFEGLIDMIILPDPDDRHVVAAAIKGRADMIVTFNLKDFPGEAIAKWGIEAQHPDDFLVNQFHLDTPKFLEAVRTVRNRLKAPPKSVDQYLDTLRGQGLLATVSELEAFDQFI